jgi:Fic family protein
MSRMLVTLLLEHWHVLRAPSLYLSVFVKRHLADHHRLLGAVRTDGDWEGWLRFFVDGVATISAEAVAMARRLAEQVRRDRERALGATRASVAAMRLLELLPRHPLVSIPQVAQLLETTGPAAAKAAALLETLGILEEVSGKRRNRVFSYRAYLEILDSGTRFPSTGSRG